MTLWHGATRKEKLKRILHLQLINRTDSKVDNQNKSKKKTPKTTLRIMMRIIKMIKVSKSKKLKNNNQGKKSKFSILFGKTLIINPESHYRSMNGSNNCKIKFSLLRKKM